MCPTLYVAKYIRKFFVWVFSEYIYILFIYSILGIRMALANDLVGVLRRANITASDTQSYNIQAIYEAVKGKFEVEPIIDCVKDKVG